MDTLIFDISGLADKSVGTRDVYSFDGPAHFEELDAKGDVVGKAEFMKMDDGINVIVSSFESTIPLNCERCLEVFDLQVGFDHAEREFYFKEAPDSDDRNDIFLVDTKNMKIDLTDMIRQEIILHFPLNLVCSSGCKGLCPVCGRDRNKEKCDCKVKNDFQEKENKPLAKLKDLLK